MSTVEPLGRSKCPTCGEELCSGCDGMGWVYDPDDGGTMCCPDCGGEPHECCGEEATR